MSRSRELRENPKNNLNLFNILSVFSDKSKYSQILMRIFTNTKNIKEYSTQIKENLVKELGIPMENFDKLSDIEIIVLESMMKTIIDLSDIKEFIKFSNYNERKLVKNNDLQSYTTFKQMILENQRIDFTIKDKELEKERIILFQDEEWICVLPLTYESSKKYGSNTRWCTASNQTSDQFFSYTKRGCLLYNINTKTGEKVAVFKDLHENNSSFWNAKDDRVDSSDTGLSDKTLSFIKKYLKSSELKPNSKFIHSKPPMKVKTPPPINGGWGRDEIRTRLTDMFSQLQEDGNIDLSIDVSGSMVGSIDQINHEPRTERQVDPPVFLDTSDFLRSLDFTTLGIPDDRLGDDVEGDDVEVDDDDELMDGFSYDEIDL